MNGSNVQTYKLAVLVVLVYSSPGLEVISRAL